MIFIKFIQNFSYTANTTNNSIDDNNIHYFTDLFGDVLSIINRIWHYKLLSMDGEPVSIANLLTAIIFLIFGLRIAKLISISVQSKLLSRINMDITVSTMLSKIIHYIFIIIITVIVLDIAHVPLTLFTFIGGTLAISIGVGGQHVLNNFISGLVLIIENPIKVGDLVEIEDIFGRVENIGARSVNLRTQENKNIFVPHSIILQNKVINWTANDNKVRLSTTLKFKLDMTSLAKFEQLLMSELTKNQNILIIPAPKILLLQFDYDLVEIELMFWVNLAFVKRSEIISEINFIVADVLVNNKLNLAAPTRRILS